MILECVSNKKIGKMSSRSDNNYSSEHFFGAALDAGWMEAGCGGAVHGGGAVGRWGDGEMAAQ